MCEINHYLFLHVTFFSDTNFPTLLNHVIIRSVTTSEVTSLTKTDTILENVKSLTIWCGIIQIFNYSMYRYGTDGIGAENTANLTLNLSSHHLDTFTSWCQYRMTARRLCLPLPQLKHDICGFNSDPSRDILLY